MKVVGVSGRAVHSRVEGLVDDAEPSLGFFRREQEFGARVAARVDLRRAGLVKIGAFAASTVLCAGRSSCRSPRRRDPTASMQFSSNECHGRFHPSQRCRSSQCLSRTALEFQAAQGRIRVAGTFSGRQSGAFCEVPSVQATIPASITVRLGRQVFDRGNPYYRFACGVRRGPRFLATEYMDILEGPVRRLAGIRLPPRKRGSTRDRAGTRPPPGRTDPAAGRGPVGA